MALVIKDRVNQIEIGDGWHKIGLILFNYGIINSSISSTLSYKKSYNQRPFLEIQCSNGASYIMNETNNGFELASGPSGKCDEGFYFAKGM